ncbi:unnamed protein product [Phytomonas sp. Hart1]|nr:unnamed protein product [Phytomonas sp. Hart1]|eukprot:CCW66260.1 unnamed protein product [Phytomonas sp. isolate Hart1]
MALIAEAARLHMQLPALSAFDWLRGVGDLARVDPDVLRFLHRAFAKTYADIPPVQFCTALKSLERGRAPEVVDPEDWRGFLLFCAETIRGYFGQGLGLGCLMALTGVVYRLGGRDDGFYDAAAAFARTKLRRADAALQDKDAAREMSHALGEERLRGLSDLREFLLAAGEKGQSGESSLLPTAWMNLHDPANRLVERTETQKEAAAVLEAMWRTRSADREALLKLAAQYIALLPRSHPDDLKEFFAVFEEKVLKEDRVLKDCLDGVFTTAIVQRLSAQTIAGILHSLATLRFTFSRSIKQFLLGVTTEQWGEMEAVPLVQILAAMARLSLRIPAVLDAVGDRLAELTPFLSPHDTADAIRSLQMLNCPDDAKMMGLIRHAASCAGRFDEASMVLLFTSPSIHRLLRSPDVAMPLLKGASVKVGSLPLRQRIAVVIRKTGLPKELIEASLTRLRIETHNQDDLPLRLT